MTAIAKDHLRPDEVQLLEKASAWFDDHRAEFIQELIEWIAIPSMSDESLAELGQPFGPAVAKAFERAAYSAHKAGFFVQSHDGYAISVRADQREHVRELGLISHLDVVPPGDNWVFDPFDAFEKDGVIVGRGALDNKGPALLDLYLLRAFRELDVPLRHQLRIVYGGAEETGMADMKYVVKHATVPHFSIITDGNFPVNHAQKGGLDLILDIPVGIELSGLKAGVSKNAVPAQASLHWPVHRAERLSQAIATLPDTQRQALSIAVERNEVILSSHGHSGHAAFPEHTQNAIPLLLDALVSANLLEDHERLVAKIIAQLLADPWGISAGIGAEDLQTGRLTLNGGLIIPHEDTSSIAVHLDIRYPAVADTEALIAHLQHVIAPIHGTVTVVDNAAPACMDKNGPLVQHLQQTFDTVASTRTEPYAMGGATHARVVPNSITFGPGFGTSSGSTFQGVPLAERPEFIPEGHGLPHGPDEFVSIDNLKRAFLVYAIAIPRLDRWLTQEGGDNVK